MVMSSLPLNTLLGYEASDKRLDILRRISHTGSISEAARSAGVSYKAAWQAIETLTNLAGTPLVEKAVGGSGGGGAIVTAAGHRLLAAADRFMLARRQVADQLAQDYAGDGASLVSGALALGMRTSMRNQLLCLISDIKRAGGAVRVYLSLDDGSTLVSRITKESAQLLGLESGRQVMAMFKATAVEVASASNECVQASSENHLDGVLVSTVRAGKVSEATVTLTSGAQVIGFMQTDTTVKKGSLVTLCVDEAAVVIASLT